MTFIKRKWKKDFQAYSWNVLFIMTELNLNKSTDSSGVTSALHRCTQSSLSLSRAAAGFLCCLRSRSKHKAQVSSGWEGVSFFKSTMDWQWSFFERLLVFVAISDPPKTMALAWEGPDLLLICFMGGLLAENFDLELSKRIRKRRASEVGGFEIRGFASDTSLLIDNMKSPLWHYKIKYKSCHPLHGAWHFQLLLQLVGKWQLAGWGCADAREGWQPLPATSQGGLVLSDSRNTPKA